MVGQRWVGWLAGRRDLRTVALPSVCIFCILQWFFFASTQVLGSDFGRTDFSQIFLFEPPDFFAVFVTGFFLLIFV